MNLEQAQKFKELYLNFLKLTNELINFIKNHQFIEGFQISTSEFYKSDSKTITAIEDYIVHLSCSNEKEEEIETLELSPEEIKDFQEFEKQNSLNKGEYNQNFQKQLSPILEIEKHDSNQKAKEEVARLVGSNLSPMRPMKKTSEEKKSEKKKNLKKPILVLGIVETKEKLIEENMKLKYQENVLAEKEYTNLVDIDQLKLENDFIRTSFKSKSLRKISNALKENDENIFQEDFDPKIFESFYNGYSFMFTVKEFLEPKIKDDTFANA